jgi:hypothetical protein
MVRRKTQPPAPPERLFANRMEKPPATASLFAQSAWWLADYAELWYDMGPHDTQDEDLDTIARCQEMAELSLRLRELDEGLRARQARGNAANAAEFILKLLANGGAPGAVYWSGIAKRWRVVGPDYKPQADDELVGIYTPDADLVLLEQDLAEVEGSDAQHGIDGVCARCGGSGTVVTHGGGAQHPCPTCGVAPSLAHGYVEVGSVEVGEQGDSLILRPATPGCDCPGNSKQDKSLHAPNCPYRTYGVLGTSTNQENNHG